MVDQLSERSRQIRRDTIILSKANGGYHWGGSFSCVEILIALYDHVMGPDDKFVLSKGQGCWPLYVILRERGMTPKLEGHPYRDERNGINYTTGSLGHGLPGTIGMGMARKIQEKPGHFFVLMSDGECQEGTTWESLLIAAFRELNNVTVIVDKNGIQGSGYVKDILPIDGLLEVARAVGWKTSVVDGHSLDQLRFTLSVKGKRPQLVIADTIKGKGVSFMEDRPEWHAKWLDDKHETLAMEELI